MLPFHSCKEGDRHHQQRYGNPPLCPTYCQQSQSKREIILLPPIWDALLAYVLKDSGKEIIFRLVMPGVEPDRTETTRREVSSQQIHDGTLASAPFASYRDGDWGNRIFIADESRD